MRLSVSLKIFLGFVSVVMSMGAVVGYNMVHSQRAQKELARLRTPYVELGDVYRELDSRVQRLGASHASLYDYFVSIEGAPRAQERDRMRLLTLRMHTRFQRLLQQIRARAGQGLRIAHLPRGDAQFLREVILWTRELKAIYQRVDDRSLHAHDREAFLEEMRRASEKLNRLGASVHRHFAGKLRARLRRTAAMLDEGQRRAVLLSAVMSGLALLIAVAMMLLAHFTLKPLRRLAEGARVIGEGDYEYRVEATARDEIGALGREFNAMAEAIEEREARLIETERLAARAERLATTGRIAAQISHEVRNPLSAVSLNAEMLEEEMVTRGIEPDSDALALVRGIQKEVDRLAEVTEGYLQFARLPTPRRELEDVGPVLEDIVNFSAGELSAAGVEVALEVQAALPQFAFDENLLRQAILNLVRNAREALEPGGGTVTLSARVVGGTNGVDRRLEICVGDDGPGIDPDTLDRIFDPFYSTKETGTGLGLAVTSQIVDEHDGKIRAESEPGGGTRVVMSFPL